MVLLLVIIVLALLFDYINGFHDAANSIATIVATKVLTPFQAVLWAAFFNFLAYWVFGFGVADTVAKTAHTSSINLIVILAGIVSAIIWNLITWWKGIRDFFHFSKDSSSHHPQLHALCVCCNFLDQRFIPFSENDIWFEHSNQRL